MKISSSEYKKCSIKEENDEGINNELSDIKCILFCILMTFILIILLIIILLIVFKSIIIPSKKSSKRIKHPEIFLSYKERLKVNKYLYDCINGILYDKKRYKKLLNPNISIIIPVYNKEKFILRILRSIQNQSFKNIEIIWKKMKE